MDCTTFCHSELEFSTILELSFLKNHNFFQDGKQWGNSVVSTPDPDNFQTPSWKQNVLTQAKKFENYNIWRHSYF